MTDNTNFESNRRSNALWVIATFVSPYIVFFTSSYILSLFWPNIRDMPDLGLLLPIDTFPTLIGIGALTYCFSEIQFPSWQTKLLTLLVALFSIVLFGVFVALITSCSVFHDCP